LSPSCRRRVWRRKRRAWAENILIKPHNFFNYVYAIDFNL